MSKSPDQYKPRLNLGVAYERTGRLADAERQYVRAVEIFPGPRATENLRMVRLKQQLMRGGSAPRDPAHPAAPHAGPPEASRR